MNFLARSAIGLTVLAVVFATLRQPSGPDIPAPRDFPKWRERVALLADRGRSNNGAKVIFIGDSITQMWETEGATAWARFVADWSALNFGVSGDCTQHALWRIRSGSMDNLQPKAVVLMIGSNNLKLGNSAADTAGGVRVVITEIQERLPNARILLMAILPREDAPAWVIREANELLRPLADGQRIVWLDCGKNFLNRNGEIQKRYFKGEPAVHPSAAGYEILERRIRAAVEPLLQ